MVFVSGFGTAHELAPIFNWIVGPRPGQRVSLGTTLIMASNKAADFEVLKTASSALAEYMRMDENSPDLLDRLTASEPGSHRYLTEPFLTQFPLQMVIFSNAYLFVS